MTDRNSPIPPWRQHIWLSWQMQMPPMNSMWEDEAFEEDEDEGIDLGTKH